MTRLGEGKICFAQLVLAHEKKIEITATELGNLIDESPQRCGFILGALGWEKVRLRSPGELYIWYRNGSDKVFESLATGNRLFKLWLKRRKTKNDSDN
jgi:hypothetical protein